MAEEIEAKILDVDVLQLEKELKKIGAKKIGAVLFRSTSFDFPGWPLDKESSWVRLRTDGKTAMLAYKRRLGVTGEFGKDAGMDEIEVETDSFDTTASFLRAIGMVEKFSQEKKRTSWRKGEVQFDIDTYPRIPTYLEIEAPTWQDINDHIALLDLPAEKKCVCSATQVYKMYGINDKEYIKMTFDEFVLRSVES